jgi:GNAT superfamily N-acetyltransferase
VTLRVRWVDERDEQQLERLLAFAASVGTPRRTTVSQYREESVGHSEHVGQAAVEDAAGELRGAVFAHVFAPIGRHVAQVNVFAVPGDAAAVEQGVEALVDWSRRRGLTSMLAHVTDPPEGLVAQLVGVGFEQVGWRTRMMRTVTVEDQRLQPPVVPGIDVLALRDVPQLEGETQLVWDAAHRDIPSALAFDAEDAPSLRKEVGIGPEDPLPESLLVAVDHASGGVLGVAYLHVHAEPVGHGGHRFTGVDPAHRGRGIARALKVELIRWASVNGLTQLNASNDAANAAMRAINESLGYVPAQRIELLRLDLP